MRQPHESRGRAAERSISGRIADSSHARFMVRNRALQPGVADEPRRARPRAGASPPDRTWAGSPVGRSPSGIPMGGQRRGVGPRGRLDADAFARARRSRRPAGRKRALSSGLDDRSSRGDRRLASASRTVATRAAGWRARRAGAGYVTSRPRRGGTRACRQP